MHLFDINKETCNQDGLCAAVCPSGIIELQDDGFPAPVADAEEVCIQCGHCVAVCPTGSFSHREMAPGECQPIKKDFLVTQSQCEQFLKGRRSIRAFKGKSVPKKVLLKLIDIARYAPTGHNTQSVQWLVLQNRDELKKLSGLTVDWMRSMVKNMPETASSFHMGRTISRWEHGADVIFRDAPAVVIAHADKEDRLAPESSIIALTYLELAAASLTIGCCWAGYFNAAAAGFPHMKKAIPLPKGHICMGAMMVGYPKFKYQRIPLRKEPTIIWR